MSLIPPVTNLPTGLKAGSKPGKRSCVVETPKSNATTPPVTNITTVVRCQNETTVVRLVGGEVVAVGFRRV